MPLRIRTEDLNDLRPELQALKAIVMGPFHMAGLSEGDREIDIDAQDIANALSIPEESNLVSLALWKDTPEENNQGKFPDDAKSDNLEGAEIASGLTSSSREGVPSSTAQRSMLQPSLNIGNGVIKDRVQMKFAPLKLGSRANAMSATFKIVPAVFLPSEEERSSNRCRCLEQECDDNEASRQILFSLESMIWPGMYLTLDYTTSSYVMRSLHSSSLAEHAEVFVFRAQIPFPVQSERSGQGNFDSNFATNVRNLSIFSDSKVEIEACGVSRKVERIVLAPPAAERYPKGARLLTGKTKKYILVPIGQLIDEHYTAYFEFQAIAPSVQLEGPGKAKASAAVVA